MKLDDLCAIKVMGYSVDPDGSAWAPFEGEMEGWHELERQFTPSTSLDDALVCLERAAGDDWDCEKIAPDFYACYCGENPQGSTAKTLCEAICLQSLRAMGVPESAISLAMEDDHAR